MTLLPPPAAAAATVTTIIGDGSPGHSDSQVNRLSRPHGLFADAAGTLYVTDSEAHRIGVLTPYAR